MHLLRGARFLTQALDGFLESDTKSVKGCSTCKDFRCGSEKSLLSDRYRYCHVLSRQSGLHKEPPGSCTEQFLCWCHLMLAAVLKGSAPMHTKAGLCITLQDLFLFDQAVLFLSLPIFFLPWLFCSFQLGFRQSHKFWILRTVACRF